VGFWSAIVGAVVLCDLSKMITYLEQIGLKVAHRFAEILAKTKIRPEQIVIFRFIIAAPASAYLFSRGEYLYNLAGLAVYIPLSLLDWVDGHLARIAGRTSALGKWLDETSDRLLMLIVLACLFYAGLTSGDSRWWVVLSVLYFSAFFFLTTVLYDFDREFNLEFKRYPEIEKEMYRLNPSPSLLDRLLYSLLYVHQNSLTKFCFTVSYPLFLGIITNQLLLTFTFITSMSALRAAGILFLIYRVVKGGETDSALTRVLRGLHHRSFS